LLRRYDGGLLRLLLQASNPKKYGPRPGFKRKRILKHERKQMEREIREEMRSGLVASNEEVREALLKALVVYRKRQVVKKADSSAALGRGGAGHEAGGEEPPRESM
jgi:hypothetical protein